MSLLYKALSQAARLREKGGAGFDAPSPGAAAPQAPPLAAERVVAQSGAGGKSAAGRWPVGRLLLFSVFGLTVIGVAVLLLMPETLLLIAAPQQQLQLIEPVAAPAAEPAPEPLAQEQPQQTEPDMPAETDSPDTLAGGILPDPPLAESSPEVTSAFLSTPPETLPETLPERIIADTAPFEPRLGRGPKRVSDAGMENFVDGQISGRENAGLGPPVDLMTGQAMPAAEPAVRQKMEITDDTDRLRADYQNAARFFDGGQPAEAQLIYARILRRNPSDRLALLGRAAAYQKMLRTTEAVSAYEAVLAAYPGDEWALINLLGLLSNQNSTQALAQLQRLIRLNPENALVPAQVGMIHLERGEYEPAARHLERAVALDPKNAKYAFNLAVAYDKWGQPAAALRNYAQSLDLAARSQEAQIPVELVRSRMAFLKVK